MKRKAVKLPIAAAGVLALTLLSQSALVQSASAADADLGKALAQNWCSACHEVNPDPAAGIPDSPPAFETLANDPAYTEDRLRGWLWAPHPPMPDLDLTRVEIDSLIAYIQTLNKN